jgi:hypothetical protein
VTDTESIGISKSIVATFFDQKNECRNLDDELEDGRKRSKEEVEDQGDGERRNADRKNEGDSLR